MYQGVFGQLCCLTSRADFLLHTAVSADTPCYGDVDMPLSAWLLSGVGWWEGGGNRLWGQHAV